MKNRIWALPAEAEAITLLAETENAIAIKPGMARQRCKAKETGVPLGAERMIPAPRRTACSTNRRISTRPPGRCGSVRAG